MNGSTWWSEPLRQWAEAVGLPLVFEQADGQGRARSLGDWWRSGSDWCMQLDDDAYARFSADSLDGRLRASLTWMMRAWVQDGIAPRASGGQASDWDELVMGWLRDLDVGTEVETVDALRGDGPPPPDLRVTARLPGRFAWLHVAVPRSHALALSTEWKSDLEDVLTEYVPQGLVGWLAHDDGTQSALLFWPERLIQADEDESTDIPFMASEDRDEFATVRRVVGQLLQMIATDALVACRAAVGQRVDRPAELHRGLAGAVVAWRTRDWFDAAEKVSVWGERPLLTLLQRVNAEDARNFLAAARLRTSTATQLQLGPELAEALRGLVAADLNVSEAARILYLHRNTLMNRIERIRQQTGYDVRHFGDAVVLWLADTLRNKLGL